MMKAWISSLFVLAIIFSFQNCQKAPHVDEISSMHLSSSHASSSKINLSSEQVQQIDVLIEEKETITRGGNTYDLMVNKMLEIDLKTGVFQVVSDLGGTPARYCLTESFKNELVSILKTSQICKSETVKDRICAQVIKPAYAQILTDVGQYDLGQSADSCGSESNDLCGDQAKMLKGFIATLKTQYKTLNCAP